MSIPLRSPAWIDREVMGPLTADVYTLLVDAQTAGNKEAEGLLRYLHEKVCEARYLMEGSAFNRPLPPRPTFAKQPSADKPGPALVAGLPPGQTGGHTMKDVVIPAAAVSPAERLARIMEGPVFNYMGRLQQAGAVEECQLMIDLLREAGARIVYEGDLGEIPSSQSNLALPLRPGGDTECGVVIPAEDVLPPFFDAGASWDKLPPERQRQLGIIALTLGCALVGIDDGDGMEATALSSAADRSCTELNNLLVDEWDTLVPGARLTPDLNAVGVQACRSCGCTDNYGCAEPCWWAEPELCSNCVGKPKEETV